MSMSPFNEHLHTIDETIGPNVSERNAYANLRQKFTAWLIKEMRRVDPVFNKLCIGVSQYPGNSERTGHCEPNAFEVICIFEFPFPIHIGLDNDRPGFVHLDMYDVLNKMAFEEYWDDTFILLSNLVDYNTAYLRRQKLNNWVSEVVEKALVSAHTFGYEVNCKQSRDEHGLVICEGHNPSKMLKIDVRPAVKFGKVNWMQRHPKWLYKTDYYYNWYAFPVESYIPHPKHTRNYTFLLSNPMAENELLWSKEHLKMAFRLLCSIRDAYDLYEIEDYMITNAMLWMLKKEYAESVVNWDLEDILIYMLSSLLDFFQNHYMPSFWVHNWNLLEMLDWVDVWSCVEDLGAIYNQLSSYPHQQNLSFGRTATHFCIH
ncbi:cyclic GMP-AMP synthase-like protein [Musca autumnalis]|uniref:cyclic GMP-AMP synthase-like protein n=1 Tax=Musca autumnalis TaxID=221902 RepID=UPI003CEBF8A5